MSCLFYACVWIYMYVIFNEDGANVSSMINLDTCGRGLIKVETLSLSNEG